MQSSMIINTYGKALAVFVVILVCVLRGLVKHHN